MPRRVIQAVEPAVPQAHPAEQLLIDEVPGVRESRVLCTTLGRGQLAAALATALPGAQVTCHLFDIYLTGETAAYVGAGEGRPTVVCAADLPAGPFDLVAIPVDPRGEAELARDLVQSAHERLTVGGRLLAAVSNPDDQWLHGEMRKLFDKVTREPRETGVVYRAVKTAPLKKVKNFRCEFAYRDQGRLIKAVSRPGVFSHRSLDAGARALINTMTVADGQRILDIGCGSGAVSFAAAFRAQNVSVVALDSHARAVECTEQGARLNGLANVTAILNAEGEMPEPGSYDLVLGNPPYYSDYRIAEIFLEAAKRALKPGGRVLMVSKSPAWFEQRMDELFANVHLHSHKLYTVVESSAG